MSDDHGTALPETNEGRDGALAALREVIEGGGISRDFPVAAASFEERDCDELIRMAWRHQFDEDRTRFKRDLRELEAQVRARILARLELGR